MISKAGEESEDRKGENKPETAHRRGVELEEGQKRPSLKENKSLP